MLQVAIVDIPTAMSTAAQNYAKVEGESVSMANNGTVNKVQTLTATNAADIKYLGDAAETARNTIVKYFTEIKDIMQMIWPKLYKLNLTFAPPAEATDTRLPNTAERT